MMSEQIKVAHMSIGLRAEGHAQEEQSPVFGELGRPEGVQEEPGEVTVERAPCGQSSCYKGCTSECLGVAAGDGEAPGTESQGWILAQQQW